MKTSSLYENKLVIRKMISRMAKKVDIAMGKFRISITDLCMNRQFLASYTDILPLLKL